MEEKETWERGEVSGSEAWQAHRLEVPGVCCVASDDSSVLT